MSKVNKIKAMYIELIPKVNVIDDQYTEDITCTIYLYFLLFTLDYKHNRFNVIVA